MDYNKIIDYITNYHIQAGGEITKRRDKDEMQEKQKREIITDENTRIEVMISQFLYEETLKLNKISSPSTSLHELVDRLLLAYGINGVRNDFPQNKAVWSIIDSEGHVELELDDDKMDPNTIDSGYTGERYRFLKGPEDLGFAVLRHLARKEGYDIANWKIDIDKSNFQNNGKIKATIDFTKVPVLDTIITHQEPRSEEPLMKESEPEVLQEAPIREASTFEAAPETMEGDLSSITKQEPKIETEAQEQPAEEKTEYAAPTYKSGSAETRRSSYITSPKSQGATQDGKKTGIWDNIKAKFGNMKDMITESFASKPASAPKNDPTTFTGPEVTRKEAELLKELNKAQAENDTKRIMDINFELDEIQRQREEAASSIAEVQTEESSPVEKTATEIAAEKNYTDVLAALELAKESGNEELIAKYEMLEKYANPENKAKLELFQSQIKLAEEAHDEATRKRWEGELQFFLTGHYPTENQTQEEQEQPKTI